MGALELLPVQNPLAMPRSTTECDKCGMKQSKYPGKEKASGFILLMDLLIVILAQHMPAKALADLIREHYKRIWRVLEHYVQVASSNEDFSEVYSVGVDETSKGNNLINESISDSRPQQASKLNPNFRVF
jgi:hypothetical protein